MSYRGLYVKILLLSAADSTINAAASNLKLSEGRLYLY
jgi:hypothetical protein